MNPVGECYLQLAVNRFLIMTQEHKKSGMCECPFLDTGIFSRTESLSGSSWVPSDAKHGARQKAGIEER